MSAHLHAQGGEVGLRAVEGHRFDEAGDAVKAMVVHRTGSRWNHGGEHLKRSVELPEVPTGAASLAVGVQRLSR